MVEKVIENVGDDCIKKIKQEIYSDNFKMFSSQAKERLLVCIKSEI